MNKIVLCLLLFSFVLIGIGFVAASADSSHGNAPSFHDDKLTSDCSTECLKYIDTPHLQKDCKNSMGSSGYRPGIDDPWGNDHPLRPDNPWGPSNPWGPKALQ